MVEVTEAAKKVADAAPAVSAPKVDFATDLFNLLSMDGPSENGSAAASNEDNGWAGVQCMTSFVWTIVTCYDLLCVCCWYFFFTHVLVILVIIVDYSKICSCNSC